MTKKKSSFTLIEVLIAIALATTACFFLLEFEESYIKKSRQSVLNLQRERLMQEALVTTLEALYTNQIDWKVIQDKKMASLPLTNSDWEARVSFSPKDHGQKVVQNLLDVEVTVELVNLREEGIKNAATFRLCLKKGEVLHVQTPA